MLYANNMHNISFVVDNLNLLGFFLLFVGQDQLGENYLTYSHNWGPRIQNTLGKKYAFHIRDIQVSPNKSCMRKISARMVTASQTILYGCFCNNFGRDGCY